MVNINNYAPSHMKMSDRFNDRQDTDQAEGEIILVCITMKMLIKKCYKFKDRQDIEGIRV